MKVTIGETLDSLKDPTVASAAGQTLAPHRAEIEKMMQVHEAEKANRARRTADLQADAANLTQQMKTDFEEAPKQWQRRVWASVVAMKAAGERPVLLRRNGDDMKAPAWKDFLADEDPMPTLKDISGFWKWAASKDIEITGVGCVQGIPPHYTHTLDFDDGNRYPEIAARVKEETGFDISTWPRQQRGDAPKLHIPFRTDRGIPKQKLAMCLVNGEPKVIVELMGKGAQVVRAPSRHASGDRYRVVQGDMLNPPVLTAEQVEKVLTVIRGFDELPEVERPPRRPPAKPGSHDSIIDRYNGEHHIADVLSAKGYTETGTDWLRHPSGENEHSVHVLEAGLAHHFSPRDRAHQVSDKSTACGVLTTPFDWYCHDEHSGDIRKAVRALAVQYGIAHTSGSEIDVAAWNAKYGVQEIETPPPAPPSGDLYDILASVPLDLSWTPKRFRRLVRAFAKVNRFLPLDANVLPALFPVSVILGKRMVCHNGSYIYYPNVWVVMLLRSGKGKSSLHILIEEELQKLGRYPVGSFTFASLFRRGGCLDPKAFKTHILNSTLDGWIKERQAVAVSKLDGQIILQEECTDRMRRAMGGWDSKNPGADVGNLIGIMDSGTNLFNETKGSGYEVLLDNCWSFFGTAQDAEWCETMDHEKFVSRGLLTRFLHGGIGVQSYGFEPDDDFTSADEAQLFITEQFRAMHLEAMNMPQVQCDIGVENDKDHINEVIHRYQSSDVFQALEKFDSYLASFAGAKLISQAIKLAMIMAFMNGDHRIAAGIGVDVFGTKYETTPTQIDVTRYFERCYDMLFRTMLGYSKFKTIVTEFSKQEEKLAQLYKKLGRPITARDAMRNCREFRRASDAHQTFDVLVGSGKWEPVSEAKAKPGPKTIAIRPKGA